MKKKKQYIILLILIAILLFSVSATCNFCGISATLGEEETSSGEEADSTETGQEEEEIADEGTGAGEAEVEEATGNEESTADNHPPEIIAVHYEDDDVTALLAAESLPVRYEESNHIFTIIAEDPDGDEMGFNIAPSHGEIVDTNRIANDSIAFSWLSPENVEGSVTALDAEIIVTVNDSAGGEDIFTIGIALMPIEDEEGVDFDFGEVESIRVSIEADSSLSGYIIKDTETRTGIVMIGDWDNNKQIKGYLTFDLSDFEDMGGIELSNAVLRFTHINKSGHPEDFSSLVDFKSYNYGSSLEPVDFAVGGGRIFTVNISEFLSPLEVSSTTLVEALETIINTGQPDFQVKIGLNSTTNNDSIGDFYQFHPSSVFLDLEFLTE